MPERPAVRLAPAKMALAYFCGSYGFGIQGMVAFLVPLRSQELRAPLAVIGLIVGFGSLVPAFLSVPSGALIDHMGARASFILGAVITGAIAVLFALAGNYWLMFPLQAAWGFGRSLAWVAAQTYITGLGTPAEQPSIAGRFSFASNVGLFLAPLVAGGVAQLLGYQLAFWVILLLSAIFVAVAGGLSELPRAASVGPGRASAGFGAAWKLVRLRGMQFVLVVTFVRLCISSGWTAFYPIFLHAKGFPAGLIGTVVSVNAAVAAVTTLGAGRLSRLASKETISATSLAIGAFGVGLSPHLWSTPFVFLPAVLLGIGNGLSLPLLLAIIRDSVPTAQRGVALGMRMTANQIAAIAVPMVVGALIPAVGIVFAFAGTALFVWLTLGSVMWYHFAGRDSRSAAPALQERDVRDG